MTASEKWEYDYIHNINLNNIEWIKLNSLELGVFFQKNYFDENENNYVNDKQNTFRRDIPLGLHYLSFNYTNNDYSFLLGIVNNNIGKKTIVANIMFLENEFLFSKQKHPITYISSVEVNSYFRNQGIYKNMCEIFINFVNPDQHIVVSRESEIGEKCKVFNILKSTLLKNGFEKEVFLDDYFHNFELCNIICEEQYTLKKSR